MSVRSGRLAVVIPCFNEELTISKVVGDAHRYFPGSNVFVFDNNSTDLTASKARDAGAHVVRSPQKGKGYVVRHALRIIDADFFLLVDGDDTYPLDEAVQLLDRVRVDHFAMAIGTRMDRHLPGSFRRYHVFGNRIFSTLVSALFHTRINDMLSGLRVLSRDLVDQIQLRSTGFEVETDLTLQAISKGFSIVEIPVSYRARPVGSHSKLNTFRDGFFILKLIGKLVKDYRPLPFFCSAAFVCCLLSLWAGWQPVADYIDYHFVQTLPRAVLAASLMILSFMFVGIGMILDSQIRAFNDQLTILHRWLRQQDEISDRKAS